MAHVFDEELLMCRETLRIEHRQILVEPCVVIGETVDTDDHRGRRVGGLEDRGQSRDVPSTVTGEDNGLRGNRRDVHRDLATTVVVERLADELTSSGRHWRALLVGSGGRPTGTAVRWILVAVP